jgi:hypothetical protein
MKQQQMMEQMQEQQGAVPMGQPIQEQQLQTA